MKSHDVSSVYDRCLADGIIKQKEDIDIELAKSLLDAAKNELRAAKLMEEKIDYYSILYKTRYDILRELISAFLLFDKIRIDNHQCLNAYICTQHSKLELDWQILETLRVLRNRIAYEGQPITKESWMTHKLHFEIYINTLIKEVEMRLRVFPT